MAQTAAQKKAAKQNEPADGPGNTTASTPAENSDQEPTPQSEGQLAGDVDHDAGRRAVMLRFDEYGEGHPLSEAQLSGQKLPDDQMYDGFDRQGYEEKPDPADKHQLNKPRNFTS